MIKHTGSVELKWYIPINKKLKVIVSSFFSVQIFDSTNSKTRPIYETLIKKMVDTLRLSTLHKSIKGRLIKCILQYNHQILFHIWHCLNFWILLHCHSCWVFFPSLFSIELEFLVYFVFNIWCDSHSNIKLWWLTQCEDNIIAMTFVQQWMKLSQQQSSSINYSFFDTAV